MMKASFPDLRGEHRTEPVPPETYCLVADIDAAIKQQIFDLPQRQRITDVTVLMDLFSDILRLIAESRSLPTAALATRLIDFVRR